MQGWPNAPADLVPQLCRLTDGNPLFLDELLRQLGYREAEQSEEGDAPVPPNLEPDRSHPGAGGPARLAAARGRDLPAAGGGGGGPRVRGGHRGRGGRADRGTAARRLRPGRGVAPAPPRRPGHPRPLRLHPHARARRHLRRAPARAPGALPPQDRRRHGAGARRRAGHLRQRAGPPLLHGRGAGRRRQGRPLLPGRGRARAAPAGLRGGGGPLRPQPRGGRAVRAPRPRGALRRARSRWRRRRTGPATRRWRTTTSSGRPRWRGPWATPSAWPPPRCAPGR